MHLLVQHKVVAVNPDKIRDEALRNTIKSGVNHAKVPPDNLLYKTTNPAAHLGKNHPRGLQFKTILHEASLARIQHGLLLRGSTTNNSSLTKAVKRQMDGVRIKELLQRKTHLNLSLYNDNRPGRNRVLWQATMVPTPTTTLNVRTLQVETIGLPQTRPLDPSRNNNEFHLLEAINFPSKESLRLPNARTPM